MKAGKIIAKLAQEYPTSMAMAWDNPGLQVGRIDRSVKKIYVALDATEEVIADCIKWGAELLVTHHPLLMSGVKRITGEDMYGRKILAMAEHGITHYAMHTNYDVISMSELAKKALHMKKAEILEVTGALEDGTVCGIGCVGDLPKKTTVKKYCEQVKKAFGLESVRVFGNPEQEVKRIAISPGSGKSMIAPALAVGAELFVTGDIGHHEGLDAVDQGMVIVDAGHYGLEHLFIGQMTEYLQKEFPDLKVKAAPIQHPFTVL